MAPGNAAFAHPAFAPFRHRLPAGALPDVALLNAWAREQALALPGGRELRFADAAGGGAVAFEAAVALDGVIGVRRDSLHDVLNALVWLAFPLAKSALNALHMGDAAGTTPNRRSRSRDAATLLDESGLLLVCAEDSLVQMLRAHDWRELFVARRDAVARAMRPLVVGHGLLEKLASPFRAITARTLILAIDAARLPEGAAGMAIVDAAAARAIADPAFTVERLPPLPVAALPGWDGEHLGERLFDDSAVFRPLRT